MKKTIIFAAVMAVAFTAKAQFVELSYGPKVGLNFANLTQDYNGKMKTSFHAGIFAEFRFNDYLALSPELVYSRQGMSYSDSDAGAMGFDKARIRLSYINLPILAKLYLTEDLSLDLGPQVGFLAGAKEWTKNGGDKHTEDVGDSFSSIDVSFDMGLSYNIYRVVLSARYNLGLTDIADGAIETKNGVIQLGVGYRF